MRKIHPAAITLRVNLLVPYGKPRPAFAGTWNIADIAPIGNGNISVHLDLHGIEIVCRIQVTGDPLQEAVLIVNQRRFAAPSPAVAMNHHEVSGRRMVEVRNVAVNNRGTDRLLEF